MKNRIKVQVYILLGLSAMTTSCDNDVIVPNSDTSVEHFIQMRVGTNWLYQIDSVYEETGKPDQHYTFYQIETVIASDRRGRSREYQIQEAVSPDSDGSYKNSKAYTLVTYDDRILSVGSDYRLVILTSPLKEKHKWNNIGQNSNNTYSSIVSVADEMDMNGTVYNHVATVNHHQNPQFDKKHSHTSFYAQDAGLIQEVRHHSFYNRIDETLISRTITKTLHSYAY